MRLNRFLASAGIDSRRKVEELILSGRVSVNGEIITNLACTVDPSKDEVTFDGSKVKVNKRVFIILNKPEGVVTTARDEFGRPSIFQMLPPIDGRVFSVGRLDIDTSGLMLLTNDGELAHKLSHPSFELGKSYRVLLKDKITVEARKEIEAGIWLAEGKTSPCKITNVVNQKEFSSCDIEIHEGFNRQIRRVFAKVGLKVKHLTRISIGPLDLGDLPVGNIRALSQDEVNMLIQAIPKKATYRKPVRNRAEVAKSKRQLSRAKTQAASRGNTQTDTRGRAQTDPRGRKQTASKAIPKFIKRGRKR